MKKIQDTVQTIWAYFRNMNSEPGTDHVSIKRNMAWGIATAAVIVELYSLYSLPRSTDTEQGHFVYMCITYVLIDLCFVLLTLGVTSVEKISSLVQSLKGGRDITPDKVTTEVKTAINEQPKDE